MKWRELLGDLRKCEETTYPCQLTTHPNSWQDTQMSWGFVKGLLLNREDDSVVFLVGVLDLLRGCRRTLTK